MAAKRDKDDDKKGKKKRRSYVVPTLIAYGLLALKPGIVAASTGT